MERKLQVFVSSTFTDLVEERQAAVESILNAGHIPAGMELFKAGDESQKETIKRWINESDAYMLILGGRYGSIDKETGKSYTHWEYDYAGNVGKPRFAIVIDEDALEEKVKSIGSHVMEIDNAPKYKEFKKEVLSRISKFYSDIRDIKLTVLESLKEFERDKELVGWVSGRDVGNYEKLLEENHELLREITKLKSEKEKLESNLKKENEIDGFSYEEVKSYLEKTKIKMPENFPAKEVVGKSFPLLELFLLYEEELAIGVQNKLGMGIEDKLIFFKMSPKLMAFNLVEKVKVTGQTYQRVQTSKIGLKFISLYEIENNKK